MRCRWVGEWFSWLCETGSVAKNSTPEVGVMSVSRESKDGMSNNTESKNLFVVKFDSLHSQSVLELGLNGETRVWPLRD